MRKYLDILIIAAFFITVLFANAVNIADPDFYWHISTGKWIVENGSLPSKDPFNYLNTGVTEGPEGHRARFILHAYWLSQVLLYLFYSFGSYWGIILYKSLVHFTLILFMYLYLKREGMDRHWAVILLLPLVSHQVFYYLQAWDGERPSYISFTFAAVLFYLLEGIRRSPKKAYLVSIPPLMLVWSNMHGAFLVGMVMIMIYLFAYTVRPPEWAREHRMRSLRPFYIAGLTGVVLAFLNPNMLNAFQIIFEMKTQYTVGIMEEKSPLAFWTKYGRKVHFLYAVLLPLAALPVIRRYTLSQILVLTGMATLALSAVRNLLFLVYLTYPLLILHWSGFIRERLPELKIKPFVRYLAAALVVLVFLLNIPSTVIRTPLRAGQFPFSSAEFIKQAKPEPGLLNYYDWGGFLIWELYPDYRVFMDGRMLSFENYYLYRRLIHTKTSRQWNEISNRLGINTVIIPPVDAKGTDIPLFGVIFQDFNWRCVSVDLYSAVFVRNTGRNVHLIREHSIDRWSLLDWATRRKKAARGR